MICFIIAVFAVGITLYNIANPRKNIIPLQGLDQSPSQSQNIKWQDEKDTTSFHLFSVRLQKELSNQIDINIDTIQFYKNKTLYEAKAVEYKVGEIRTLTDLGEGFREDHQIDSSKYYYSLAIHESRELNDTSLLERAIFGYGWMLIYDSVPVPQLIYQILDEANCIAHQSKDTLYQIYVLNRLAQYYYYKKEYKVAHAFCMESQNLAEIKKDTTGIINNLYAFESIYSDLRLYDRQLEVVDKALKLSHFIRDTPTLYTIYRTASRGFLINHLYDSCLYYARLNIPFAENQHRMPLGLTHIARAYLETNQMDSAKYYYAKILMQRALKKINTGAEEYLDFGKIEYKLGNLELALKYYNRVLEDEAELDLSTKGELYKSLSDYYIHANQYDKAINYLNKSISISDSIAKYQPGVAFILDESKKFRSQIALLNKNTELQVALASQQKQQRNLVFVGSGIIFFLLGIGFYRFQKNKNLLSRQALLHQRLQISRDLHDEVGSTLSGIAMYSHLAKEQINEDHLTEVKRSLDIMQESSGEMVDKLSDIVWLLNPEHDTLQKLLEKLGDYARLMANIKNIKIKMVIPNLLKDDHLSVETRRNIYLICKESINNAIKYSQATSIEIRVESENNKLRFSVDDNGIGFDLHERKSGNGLKNIRHRADEIGAELDIVSGHGQGTRIELNYNLLH